MQQEDLYAPDNTVRLFSGRYVNVTTMTEKDICLLDICHALSLKPRFNGNCDKFYSIAAHSNFVASICMHKREACLHDGSEAYLFDVPSPMKVYFPDLIALEKKLQAMINKKYGLPIQDGSFTQELKVCDKISLEYEWSNCMMNNTVKSTPHVDEMNLIENVLQTYDVDFQRHNFRPDNIKDELKVIHQRYYQIVNENIDVNAKHPRISIEFENYIYDKTE